MKPLVSLLPLAALLLATLPAIVLDAVAGDADWPQWRGPHRDGHAAEQELLESWPKEGPKLKWTFSQSGRGYSAMSIVDGRLYTMGSDEEKTHVLCVDIKTGQEIWKSAVGKSSVAKDYNHGWGGGPRATPTVDGDHVFATTDLGVVSALDLVSGDVLWSVDLVETYGGDVPVWGYSESPLVDDDRVVVTPGGANFMVALDRKTGEKVWQSVEVDAPVQYVSPIKGTIGKKSFYVTASKPGLFAFDVKTGEKLFSDETTGNKVAVIPTPILDGNLLYHTSDYGAGNTLLKLMPSSTGINTESLYHLSGKTMRNHHGGVVLVDGVIYGCTKINGGVWMAQDLKSGEVLWQKKIGRNKSGSLCYADGKLYCYNDKDGTCYLVEPSREEWKSVGMVTLPQETELERDKGAIWAHPVVADQTLFIRDQDLIFAFDIAARQ